MGITVKDMQDMFNKDVFTSKGVYCGKITDIELDIGRFKVRSLVIEAAKNSVLGKMVGGKKGIIVPYPVVQAVGDVVLVNHKILSGMPDENAPAEEMAEQTA